MRYLITARFTKRMTKGILTGVTFRESMSFVSVKAAEDWHKAINSAKTLNYVIEDFYIENPAYA